MSRKTIRLAKLYALAILFPVVFIAFLTGNLFAAMQMNYSLVKVVPADQYYSQYGKLDCPQPKRYEF